MVEENKQEEVKQEDNQEVSTIEEKSLLEQIREERTKLEEVRNKVKSENDRAEKLMAEAQLSGKGYSGVPNKPREETAKEYAERIMKGDHK